MLGCSVTFTVVNVQDMFFFSESGQVIGPLNLWGGGRSATVLLLGASIRTSKHLCHM